MYVLNSFNSQKYNFYQTKIIPTYNINIEDVSQRSLYKNSMNFIHEIFWRWYKFWKLDLTF